MAFSLPAFTVASFPPMNTTDAEFRAWVQGVHDLFAASDLVQTADTGQIDPATVSRTATNNTAVGYEIWRFADAQQAAFPLFMKITYGTGWNSRNEPQLGVSIGTGSDGSGTLTGKVTSELKQDTQGLPSREAVLAQGEGLCSFMQNADSAGSFNSPLSFAVERLRDADGTPNAKGAVLILGAKMGSTGGAVILEREASAQYHAMIPTFPASPVYYSGTDWENEAGERMIWPAFSQTPEIGPLVSVVAKQAQSVPYPDKARVEVFEGAYMTYKAVNSGMDGNYKLNTTDYAMTPVPDDPLARATFFPLSDFAGRFAASAPSGGGGEPSGGGGSGPSVWIDGGLVGKD